ncbi:hypothetical protein ASPZODRAFT_285021 [Penicilliopsis zonata CBS 506.65]|uniref:Uncharacterized protein n=1 Tax=Penicilliopsis zonata CBS 506.65 TaxID=1073090 RepID=A0A1L9SUL7_9EURO|nr:hypothetical protein ASPZODRAFT_285021 [Penicilliopsis zonata CBS 506.65]OJJ50910.1 hypothetical protein ASPZODRAFT_285021 [Penicilliopsis zonata CBS 506.65]
MQSLWSRAAASPSTCRCVSCLSTASQGLASRSASAASRRRLRIANSVTALYSSIFAAAALADARAKDQRRLELQEQIAAAKEEFNELVDEETRLVKILASRRDRQVFGRPVQTRQFSTATPWYSDANSWGLRRNHPAHNGHGDIKTLQTIFAESTEMEPGQLERHALEDVPGYVGDEMDEKFDMDDDHIDDAGWNGELPNWLSTDVARMKAIQMLAIKQLAIRYMLRPALAHNYSGLPMRYNADFETPQLKTTELLKELNVVRRRIQQLKNSRTAPFDDLRKNKTVLPEELLSHTKKLDDELEGVIDRYLSDSISLPEFLLRLSGNLMHSADPDRPRAFRMIILAFTKTHQNDLVDLTLRTLLPNKFLLTTSLITTIVAFFRKSKNLQGFDSFMKMLRGEGHPVNLGLLHPYQRRVINHVEITVPPFDGTNPVIYAALIHAALRFNQPHRADAWLQAARSTGFMDDQVTITAYLRHYTLRKDWEGAIQVLRRSLAFIASSSQHDVSRIEKIIVLMVYLCDSCRKPEVAQLIINAAVRSGFDWGAAEEQTEVESRFDPHLERWRQAAQAIPDTNPNQLSWEKFHSFSSEVGARLDAHELHHNVSSEALRERQANRLSEDVLYKTLSGYSDKPIELTEEERLSAGTDQASISRPAEPFFSPISEQDEKITSLRKEVSLLKKIVLQLHQAHLDGGQYLRHDVPDRALDTSSLPGDAAFKDDYEMIESVTASPNHVEEDTDVSIIGDFRNLVPYPTKLQEQADLNKTSNTTLSRKLQYA